MFRKARRRTGIRRAFAHSSYLINLASPDPSAWAQAVTAFTDELERAEALDLSCVVIHPGSHMGAGLEAGLRRVIAALDETLAYQWLSHQSRAREHRGRRQLGRPDV